MGGDPRDLRPAQRQTRSSEELAVMLDTFHPLHVAREAITVEDPHYARSRLAGGR